MTAPNSSNSNSKFFSSLRDLTTQFAQAGQLQAIYCRPARGVMAVQSDHATAITGRGLQGD